MIFEVWLLTAKIEHVNFFFTLYYLSIVPELSAVHAHLVTFEFPFAKLHGICSMICHP